MQTPQEEDNDDKDENQKAMGNSPTTINQTTQHPHYVKSTPNVGVNDEDKHQDLTITKNRVSHVVETRFDSEMLVIVIHAYTA